MQRGKPNRVDVLKDLLTRRDRLIRSIVKKTDGKGANSKVKRELDDLDWAIEELSRSRYRLG